MRNLHTHNVKDTPQAIKGQYSLNIIQPPLAQPLGKIFLNTQKETKMK